MTDVKLAEDRPRNINYQESIYDISLIFSWADAGTVPSGIRIRAEESESPANHAKTTGLLEKEWSSFEEAVEKGKQFARHLIAQLKESQKQP